MRQRNVSPDFFTSSQVIACSWPARLLFVGLWCLADREGRLRDDPPRIKRQLFPDDPIDANALLDELAANGLIRRYRAQGQACLVVDRFSEHQHVHPKEAASSLPAEELHGEPGNYIASPSEYQDLRNIKPSEGVYKPPHTPPRSREPSHIASLLPDALHGFSNG